MVAVYIKGTVAAVGGGLCWNHHGGGLYQAAVYARAIMAAVHARAIRHSDMSTKNSRGRNTKIMLGSFHVYRTLHIEIVKPSRWSNLKMHNKVSIALTFRIHETLLSCVDTNHFLDASQI